MQHQINPLKGGVGTKEGKRMKIGGMIGGVSWHSTKQIYEWVNASVNMNMGRHNCAELVLVNVNLEDVLCAIDGQAKGAILAEAAVRLEKAGASFVSLCSNGLHQYAEYIEEAVDIPFIHIADVTADVIIQAGFQTVGLLGVKETMEQPFYKNRLNQKGLRVLIPEESERNDIDRILFQETCFGVVKETSKQIFYNISRELITQGAECIILGCTEIDMLMEPGHLPVPLFDTTRLYAQKIAQMCCGS